MKKNPLNECFPSKESKKTHTRHVRGIRLAMVWLACLALPCIMYAQEQRLTVKLRNVKLEQAIDQLQKDCGCYFLYNSTLVNPEQRVSVDKTNESLPNVLNALLQGTDVKYKIDGSHVVLYVKNPSEATNTNVAGNSGTPMAAVTNAVPSGSQQNTITVRGSVLDDTGSPLPGAAVVVKNNIRKNVTTDVNGKFELADVDPNASLVVSFLGYETLEYVLNGKANIEIALKSSSVHLDEVVVTGYQTISKERSSGSFAIVTSEKLESKLQPSVKSVLEGQAAGMVLTKDGKIEIRGVSTFNGTKDPLIVLDGYPLMGRDMNIDFVNPENIESITVLKDAVAASIYGSQSSNGVIVITTKSSGMAAKGRNYFNINYKGTYGVTLKPDLDKLNISSVADYMDAELDLYNQDPNSYNTSYNSYNKLSDYTYLLWAKDKAVMTASEADAKIDQLKNNNALKAIQDKLIQAKQSQQHNFSIASGNDVNQFSAMLRYMGETGNVLSSDNSRVTFDINDTWSPKKWLSLKILSNLNYTRANTPTETYLTLTNFSSTSKILPYSELYDEEGNASYWRPVGQRRLPTYESTAGMKSILYHPEQDIPLAYASTNNLQVRLGGDVTLKFFDFLQGSFGGTWTRGASTSRTILDGKSFNMRTAYNDGTSRTNNTKHYIPEGGKIDENRGTMDTWIVRTQMNYNQSFNDKLHRITAIAGFEVTKDTYETSYLPTRLGYDPVSASYNSGFNPYEYNNNTGNISGDMLFSKAPAYLGGISYGSNYSVQDKRTVSWYGTGSYECNSKYVINGSIRWELSNFYGTDPKYRYKPTWSIGGTYKMAEEDYFSGLRNIFDRFNIRASYGVLGSNALAYTPFLVLSVGSYSTTTGGVSYGVSSYPNNQLRYEKKNTFDAGLDITLLNNRINITLDYYRNKSHDLLANEAVDVTRGTTALVQNVGELTNTGLELNINAGIIKDNNFSWNSNLIASYNVTNVDHYNVSRMYFTSYATAAPIMVEGYSADGFWGGRFSRIDNRGVALFYDQNNNEVEGGSLKGADAVYLGTLRPPLDMSWTNSFRYKNLEASFMFIAKFGAKYRKDCFSGSNYINRHVGERWRKPGDEATVIYPKLTSWNMDMFYYPYSDILAGNANYLKLRDLTIGYNLPKKWINAIGLTGVKAYFQTRNLFYITAKGVDIDPETAEYNASGGTGAMTNQGYTSLQLRPEFYFGIMINL